MVRLLACFLMACAPAMPAWSGASTTPKARTDLALGGAARLPVGALRDAAPFESRYRDTVEGAGVVPVAAVRHGLTHHLDLGVLAAGTLGRLELRGEWNVREGSTRTTLMWAAAAYGGAIADMDGGGSGGRVGLDLPLVWGGDFGGLYDVWLGARVGVEHAWGSFDAAPGDREPGSATSIRAGGLFGIAAGFRRIHAFVELTAAYEHWFAAHAGQSLSRGGLVLTPAFGLRVRI